MASTAPEIVVLGAGLAGLFTALQLAPLPVSLVAAAPLGDGAGSAWAQGGIAAAVGDGDTPQAHAADTVAAGAGLVDAALALAVAREGPERIADLLAYGVPFDRDLAGRLALSREAAHSARRVVRVNGDLAGRAIVAALVAAVRTTPSIRVIEGLTGETLIVDDGRVRGLVARPTADPAGAAVVLPARATVVATGGIGRLYAVTTNPEEACGHGLAMGARAGAVVADAEFVQFHPTALAVGRDPAPLASEALRGDGALLVDGAGRRFMADLHPDAELAPRDVVARGVFAAIAAGRGAFLDCRPLGPRLADRFPTLAEACRAAGLDPTRAPLPIAPAAHYHMGGLAVDAAGRTTVAGLWACGEVAATGLHGANRLASNALLESVVFAARIAADIAGHLDRLPRLAGFHDTARFGDAARMGHAGERRAADGISLAGRRRETAGLAQATRRTGAAEAAALDALRRVMAAEVGVVRDADGLARALAAVAALDGRPLSPRDENQLVAARLVAASALARRESRGAHQRRDHPASDPAAARSTRLTLAEAEATAARAAERAW